MSIELFRTYKENKYAGFQLIRFRKRTLLDVMVSKDESFIAGVHVSFDKDTPIFLGIALPFLILYVTMFETLEYDWRD